jgi:hypothetical protein
MLSSYYSPVKTCMFLFYLGLSLPLSSSIVLVGKTERLLFSIFRFL